MTANPETFSLADWLADPGRRPMVMGIINATPDSFSDGAQFVDPAVAADHAAEMAAGGAGMVDVGGESTRPGSQPVPEDEQVRRVVPVVAAIVRAVHIPISIDTTRSAVARAAVDAGATLVNDVSAGRDDAAMLPLVARLGLPIALMHMRGTPATMQNDPRYNDVTGEVRQFLLDRAVAAQAAGIDRGKIVLDPGLGFGKTDAHNLQLLRDTASFVQTGYPVLVGPSRKGFIGRISGDPDPTDRRFGTAAAVAWAIAHGAAIVRVHDVRAMSQVVATVQAIRDR